MIKPKLISLDESLRWELEVLAAKARMNLKNYIEHVLKEQVERHGKDH